jgi:peptidoglycan hydrolase CwlO-like protein
VIAAPPGARSEHVHAPLSRPHRLFRAVVAASVSAALLGTGLTAPSSGDLQSQIAGTRSAAASLRAEIAADSRQIAGTANGVANAEARLAATQQRLDERVAELKSVQAQLLAARNHLVALENRLHAATTALSANLVSSYESGQPNIVSVILSSKGFSDLLNQMGFMSRVAHQDANILKFTRTARAEVARQATALEGLEARDRTLAAQVLAQRNHAAALRTALLHEQIAEESKRANTAARYDAVKGHLGALQARLNRMEKAAAEAATRAAATGNANVSGIAVNTAGMV